MGTVCAQAGHGSLLSGIYKLDKIRCETAVKVVHVMCYRRGGNYNCPRTGDTLETALHKGKPAWTGDRNLDEL